MRVAYERNKDPTQASNFHKHLQKGGKKKNKKRKKRKGEKKEKKKKLDDPTSISFLTIWNKISMWHL